MEGGAGGGAAEPTEAEGQPDPGPAGQRAVARGRGRGSRTDGRTDGAPPKHKAAEKAERPQAAPCSGGVGPPGRPWGWGERRHGLPAAGAIRPRARGLVAGSILAPVRVYARACVRGANPLVCLCHSDAPSLPPSLPRSEHHRGHSPKHRKTEPVPSEGRFTEDTRGGCLRERPAAQHPRLRPRPAPATAPWPACWRPCPSLARWPGPL